MSLIPVDESLEKIRVLIESRVTDQLTVDVRRWSESAIMVKVSFFGWCAMNEIPVSFCREILNRSDELGAGFVDNLVKSLAFKIVASLLKE